MLYVNPIEYIRTGEQNTAALTSKREKVALEEFEHILLNSMLEEMHKSATWGKKESNPEKGFADDMFNDSFSSIMAKSGQMGVAKQVEWQISHPGKHFASRS